MGQIDLKQPAVIEMQRTGAEIQDDRFLPKVTDSDPDQTLTISEETFGDLTEWRILGATNLIDAVEAFSDEENE